MQVPVIVYFPQNEVAEILGYTVRSIDRLIAARRIPFVRVPAATGAGTKIRFDSRQIDAMVQAGYQAPEDALINEAIAALRENALMLEGA